ncbi:Golgin subfamily A member 7/ERF4 family-domain-containing protein [Xylaria castorea]|nr:Golgin subfamily A member 7/ERF4 family-domain-containing protein [Xylaria castorea]
MHVLELPIPACMNSANLFPTPLNANIPGGSRYSPSPRNGQSHSFDDTTRLRHPLGSGQRNQHRKSSRRGGFGFFSVFPTASRATTRPQHFASAAVGGIRDKGNNRDKANVVISVSQQPDHPSNSNRSDNPAIEATTVHPTRSRRHHTHQNSQEPGLAHSSRLLPLSLRNRAAGSGPENYLPRSTGTPGRLWNPTNSTPRLPPVVYTRPARTSRKRRPSTPPPPAVPLNHPALDDTRAPDDQAATGAGDYPLLTLPEQRQSRHLTSTPTPTRSSFQIEERLNEGKRVSLPSSVRHSYDFKRTLDVPSEVGPGSGLAKPKPRDSSFAGSHHKRGQSVTKKSRARAVSFGLVHTQSAEQSAPKLDKGKGKEVMSSPTDGNPTRGLSTDLERGPSVLDQQLNRSTLSIPGGIGSAISSSNSSIIGDPNQPGLGDEWGPQHPCFPHMNPYVPVSSTEYQTTRIIRVRRDWLIAGDLAPTFSNLYPEILDPAGISEQEFRRVIEKLNGSLIPIFSPYNWRNILDGVLGVLTAWVWEDLGFTNVKTKLNELERWIDKWNAEMEKTAGSEEGAIAPKIISLRRTGYMSLDFQIPNPEVSISNSEPASRSGPPEPEPFASAVA